MISRETRISRPGLLLALASLTAAVSIVAASRLAGRPRDADRPEAPGGASGEWSEADPPLPAPFVRLFGRAWIESRPGPGWWSSVEDAVRGGPLVTEQSAALLFEGGTVVAMRDRTRAGFERRAGAEDLVILHAGEVFVHAGATPAAVRAGRAVARISPGGALAARLTASSVSFAAAWGNAHLEVADTPSELTEGAVAEVRDAAVDIQGSGAGLIVRWFHEAAKAASILAPDIGVAPPTDAQPAPLGRPAWRVESPCLLTVAGLPADRAAVLTILVRSDIDVSAELGGVSATWPASPGWRRVALPVPPTGASEAALRIHSRSGAPFAVADVVVTAPPRW